MRSWIVALLPATVVAVSAHAQPAGVAIGPWRTQLQGAAVHQFETDLDGGGSFSVDRAYIEAGLAYAFSPRDSVGLAFAYGYDGYDFDADGNGLAALDPWGDVDGFRLSAPLRAGIGERIDLFAAPSVRWRAESGADLGDAATAGGTLGATWRFSDDLRLGAGLGAFAEIEDDATIFPILLIDWRVTDSLSIETGQGLGATRGPGLAVNWTGLDDWRFTLGARWETWRFRLDDAGPAPDGVGEEEAIPVFAAAAYEIIPPVRVSVVGGVDVGGSLTLEDEDGREIAEEDFDPAPFLGATFRARF
jgi:outer membrane receptor protein involved in Fe transport